MNPSREAAFSLGSNLGDSLARLREARQLLAAGPGVTELAASSVYETSPVDVPAEFAGVPFLNAVLVLEGRLDAAGWHRLARGVEDRLGRVRDGRRNVPRTIDIDLLYCGRDTIDTPGLQVPHPRWSLRRFVLAPLAEVRPERVLPGTDRNVAGILAALESKEDVRKTSHIW